MADIVEMAIQDGHFTTLVTALKAAGMVDTLKGMGPFTVFAPTDEAFEKLPAGTVQHLLDNPELLRDVLGYHVIAGKFTSDEITAKEIKTARTVEGEDLHFDTGILGVVHVDDATVAHADIMTDNGVLHVIDQVLLPGKMRGQMAA